MKKRVVSLLLAAVLAVSALAGCGSDSNDSESESVVESVEDKGTSSESLNETNSDRTGERNTEGTPSGPPDYSHGSGSGEGTNSESGVGTTNSTGAEENTAPSEAESIAKDALEKIIRSNNTVEYSYMNTVSCLLDDGTEVSAETTNGVKAYGKEDDQENVLTVIKESELKDLSQNGQILKREKYWYDQTGEAYIYKYDEASGTYDEQGGIRQNYGSGMTWMNETGLKVYQEIAEGNIKPGVFDKETKYSLYFVLTGDQTKKLFGRLIDDISIEGTSIDISGASEVKVQVVVKKETFEPYVLSIKAAGFESDGLSSGIYVRDFDISLVYARFYSSEPIAPPGAVPTEGYPEN